MEVLLSTLGISGVLGGIFWHEIDMARYKYKISKHSDTWWANKTALGKSLIILSLVLGVCGLIMMVLIIGMAKFWNKYCCKAS
jgi:hypothetical protein